MFDIGVGLRFDAFQSSLQKFFAVICTGDNVDLLVVQWLHNLTITIFQCKNAIKLLIHPDNAWDLE